jgi:hypothetical protein
MKAALVNCAPSSVLNIFGARCRASAFVKRRDAKARIHRVRQAQRQNRPAGPVDNRHQIQKAKRHRNIGDVAGPDVIGPGDAHAAQQIRIDLVVPGRGTGASIPITRISLCTLAVDAVAAWLSSNTIRREP